MMPVVGELRKGCPWWFYQAGLCAREVGLDASAETSGEATLHTEFFFIVILYCILWLKPRKWTYSDIHMLFICGFLGFYPIEFPSTKQDK